MSHVSSHSALAILARKRLRFVVITQLNLPVCETQSFDEHATMMGDAFFLRCKGLQQAYLPLAKMKHTQQARIRLRTILE